MRWGLHDEDIAGGQRVSEEVACEKFHPVRNATLGYKFLKDWFDLGQIVTGARKMRMRAGHGCWQHALRASDIDK